MSQTEAKPILIIQTAFIGDTILATSFAHSVHERFPDAPLHFVLRKGNESVVQGLPCVHKVWVWDKGQGKVRALWRLIAELRQYQFQTVFNLHRHFNSGLITALMRARNKVGFWQNPLALFYSHRVHHRIPHIVSGRAWHEVQRNLQLLQAVDKRYPIPFKLHDFRPKLPLQESHRKKVKAYQEKPYVVVAPASVWFTKQWALESFSELVERLSASLQVLLIGSPADHALCEQVKGKSSAINLCGELNLLESAALMEKAQRVFVNDSAPLHLASAVNAKTTAFFCSTIPQFGYGPLADDAIVLESLEKLDCRPCGLHGHRSCPHEHFNCGRTIKVEAALSRVT